jgi:hypothetical protein
MPRSDVGLSDSVYDKLVDECWGAVEVYNTETFIMLARLDQLYIAA